MTVTISPTLGRLVLNPTTESDGSALSHLTETINIRLRNPQSGLLVLASLTALHIYLQWCQKSSIQLWVMNLVATTIGPTAVGFALSTFLFGFITVQTHTYFSCGLNDPIPLRILVALVWVIELVHQIGLLDSVWWLMVANYGNLSVLITERCPVSVSVYILFNGLASLLVSSFFIYRLQKVTGQRIIPVFLALLLAARTAGNIALAVYAQIRLSAADLLERSRTLLLACWAMAAALDVLLAIALSYDLYLRRRTSSYQTANIIDRIILWTVGTGFITSMAAVTMLILFAVIPGTNLIWWAIYIPMPRFFALSLLASLNGRIRIRAQDSRARIFETPLRDLNTNRNVLAVRVEKETTAIWDSEIGFAHGLDSADRDTNLPERGILHVK